MMSRGCSAFVCVLALLGAGSASAQELVFHVANDTEYNSNFRGFERHEEASFRNLIGPHMTIQDPYGRFTYTLDYIGQYSWYIEPWNSKLNSWEQTAQVSSSYVFSRRTTLSVTESFRDLASVRFGAADQTADALSAGQSRFRRNSFGLELEHFFTPRLAGTLTGQHDWLDYDRNLDQSDSSSVSAQGQLQYSLTRADRVGGGISYAYQTFDGELGEPSAEGQIWNASVSWDHRFADDLRLRMSGGPTYIQNSTSNDVRVANYKPGLLTGTTTPGFLTTAGCSGTNEKSCTVLAAGPPGQPLGDVRLPILNGSDSQDDFTFFARAGLTKSWIDWDFSGDYTRRQSNAAGDSGASTLDRASLRVAYDPNRTWDVYGTVGWQRRERATQQAVLDDFEVIDDGSGFALRQSTTTRKGAKNSRSNDQISAVLGASRQFSRLFRGNFEFRFRRQYQQRSNSRNTTADFYVLNVRFDYSLAPIRF